MQINNAFHLTYCTNIHAEKNWETLFTGLQNLLPSIKRQVSPTDHFGLGLRLSDNSARELLEGKNLLLFKQWLEGQKIYVFTLNGFPYGNFHQNRVKDDVHKPDWTTKERVEYTKRLCRILSVLLPEGMDGGISTSPLSYKPWFYDSPTDKNKIFKKAAEHLAMVVEEMISIRRDTGKILHVDIEPEPDGLIEDTDETISFFQHYLLPEAANYLTKKTSLSSEEIEKSIKEHIRICYDLCHFALQYEDHKEAIEKFTKAGIKIGKVQLSSAVSYTFTKNAHEKNLAYDCLEKLDEQTYLHQVVQANADKTISQYPDLSFALTNFNNPTNLEWRVHYHVPLFTEKFGALNTTRKDVEKFLTLLQEGLPVTQLEVETYTWEVMPGEFRLDISESIAKELLWVRERLEIKEKVK